MCLECLIENSAEKQVRDGWENSAKFMNEWLKNGGEFSYATDYDRDNLKQMFRAMRGKER